MSRRRNNNNNNNNNNPFNNNNNRSKLFNSRHQRYTDDDGDVDNDHAPPSPSSPSPQPQIMTTNPFQSLYNPTAPPMSSTLSPNYINVYPQHQHQQLQPQLQSQQSQPFEYQPSLAASIAGIMDTSFDPTSSLVSTINTMPQQTTSTTGMEMVLDNDEDNNSVHYNNNNNQHHQHYHNLVKTPKTPRTPNTIYGSSIRQHQQQKQRVLDRRSDDPETMGRTENWSFSCIIPESTIKGCVGVKLVPELLIETEYQPSKKKSSSSVQHRHRQYVKLEEHWLRTQYYVAPRVKIPEKCSRIHCTIQIVEYQLTNDFELGIGVSGVVGGGSSNMNGSVQPVAILHERLALTVVLHDHSAAQFKNHVYFVHPDYVEQGKSVFGSLLGSSQLSVEHSAFSIFLCSAIAESLHAQPSQSLVNEKNSLELFARRYESLFWCHHLLSPPSHRSSVTPQHGVTLHTNVPGRLSEKMSQEIWAAMNHSFTHFDTSSIILAAELITLWDIVLQSSNWDLSKLRGLNAWTKFLDQFHYDSLRKVKKIVPPLFESRFVSALENLLRYSARTIDYQWVKFVPFIMEFAKGRSDELIQQLKELRTVSKKKDFKRIVDGWIKEFDSLFINSSDMEVLVETMFDVCPGLNSCPIIYEFVSRKTYDYDHLFSKKFAGYVNKCEARTLTKKRLRSVKSKFLDHHPSLYTTVFISSLLKNPNLIQVADKEQHELIFSFLRSYGGQIQMTEDVNIVADQVDKYIQALIKAHKSSFKGDVAKSLNYAINIYRSLLKMIRSTAMESQTSFFMRGFERNNDIFTVNSSRMLYAILDLGTSQPDGPIVDVLVQKVSQYCKQLLSSGNAQTRERLAQNILDMTNGANIVATRVLSEVIESIGEYGSISAILANQVVWNCVLGYPWKNTSIEDYCQHVILRLECIAESVNTNSIKYEELSIICQNSSKFIELCTWTQAKVSEGQLKQFVQQVKQYRSSLEDIKFYLNNYGRHQNVDSSQVEAVLSNVERNSTGTAFQTLLQSMIDLPIYNDLKFLRKLGENDVFLRMYNTLTEEASKGSEQNGDDGSDNCVNKLSLREVVDKVVPSLKDQWSQLYRMIDSRQISFEVMQHHFGNLQLPHLFRTLQLLRETRHGVTNNQQSSGDEWVEQRYNEIRGFIYVLGRKTLLPQVICVVFLFGQSFQGPVEDDLFRNINLLYESLETNWMDGILSRVSDILGPAERTLKHFSELDFKLIQTLQGCEKVLEWLYEQRDNNNFNEKIRVARSVNDDAILLQSLASLTETRQYLYPLLYPNYPFYSSRAFFDTLKSINHGQLSENEINEKIRNIGVTRANLDLIKESVARVNASPGVQACLQVIKIHNSGRFIVDTSPNAHVCCLIDSNSKSLEDLIDLQTTLLNIKIPDEFRETHPTIDDIVNNFVSTVQTISRLQASLQELCSNAHLEYSHYQKGFRADRDLAVIQQEAEILKLENTKWIDSIEEIRDRHYFVNYFTMKQIKIIVYALDNMYQPTLVTSATQRILSLLLLIDRTADTSVVDAFVRTFGQLCIQHDFNLQAKDRLELLADTLDRVFLRRKFVARTLSNDEVDQDEIDDDMKPLSIIGCPETDIPNTVFSLFVQKGRLPEPDEVMMCYAETTNEDALLLLRRWAKASKYGLTSKVYVLAGFHRLNYSIQCAVVDSLKLMLPHQKSSSLFLVGDNIDRQRLANAFSTFIAGDRAMLSREELREAYQSVCKSEYCRNIVCVKSNICGGGKTSFILGECYENQSTYYRFSLREEINMRDLISTLDDAKTTKNVVYHVDISPSVSKTANDVLFELLIVGTLQDRVTGRIHHKSPTDSFFVEIPNTPGDRCITKVLTLCGSLPTTIIRVAPTSMDINTYTVRGNMCQIEQHSNEPLQFVCKILEAHKRQVFSNPDIHNTWHPDTTPMIEPPICYDLLLEASRTSQPSFALLANFVKFTYPQFKSLMEYTLLNILSDDREWREIKSIIIELILETARDFAVRQISLNFSDHDPSIEEYTERFKTLKKWHESKHPVLLFAENNGLTCGLNLISLDPHLIDQFIPDKGLQQLVQANGIDLRFNFTQSVREIGQRETEAKCLEKLKLLAGQMAGYDETMREYTQFMIKELLQATDYVLTEDNLMKMFAIVMRFERDLPVIITGETGAGKSFLIQYLCTVLEYNLSKIVIHGGHSDEDIFNFMRLVKERALQAPAATFVVFLDEVNTTNSLGAIKEIVCDKFLDGQRLPENIRIVCALNPYRKRTTPPTEEAGLIFKHASVQSLPDPLETLAYRVFPIPDTFAESLFDFGQIDDVTEHHYIHSMLRKGLNTSASAPRITSDVLDFVADILFRSQSFIRTMTQEISSVSLRDIDRAVRLLKWFDKMTPDKSIIDLEGGKIIETDLINRLPRLLALTLGHVYYTRLSRDDRFCFIKKVEQWSQSTPWPIQHHKFQYALAMEQRNLTMKMNPGAGIALNEALCENIFMIVTSAINRIPIFIIGPPGSSKSLAIDLIAKAMKGKSSADPYLRDLPSFDIFTHQCSPLSTASGIEKSFRTARTYAKDAKNSLVVLVLDEIGLAEQSPFMPLKVLHQELESKDIATVAISNFSLDAAKMNRAVFLLRSTPTCFELQKTAEGIVNTQSLKNNLEPLARSYETVYNNQKVKNFFGLREFYYLVKYINANIRYGLTPDVLLRAVMRNFGGRDPQETTEIIRTFSSRVMDIMEQVRPSNRELIEDNLKDLKARHLMLLTQNNAALNLLFDFNILESISDVELIFGTDFPADKTNFNISLDLQRIKLAMASGRKVVLVHADSLYESLYDLLNQHYVQVENLKYARLAFGSSSVTCPVHDNFRIIVITEMKDVQRLSAPFLNRLEKQILLRKHLMTDEQRELENQLSSFVGQLKTDSGLESDELFIGSHGSTLTSLVQSIEDTTDQDILSDNCSEDLLDLEHQSRAYHLACSRLIYTMTPESVLSTGNMDLIHTYFKKQVHTDLNSLLDLCLHNYHKVDRKDSGIQLVVNTHAPLDVELESSLIPFTKERDIKLHFLQLHEMQSSLDLTRACDDFLESDSKEALLVLVCDPTGSSLRRIRYAQYELESRKNKCKNGRTRHIVLIITIMRTSNVVYTFDFDKRWRYVYIDDVRTSKSDLPSTTDMISLPLSTLLETKVDVIGILKRNIHNALSRIIYPQARTKQQIQTQIKSLKHWLTSHDECELKFATTVRRIIIDFVKQSGAMKDDDWFRYVASDIKELYVCGTFRSALHQHIQKVCYLVFSSLIADTDRNSNFVTLTAGTEEDKRLWLALFPSVARVRYLEPIYQQLISHHHIEVKHDEKTALVRSLFPFSYRIARFVHSFRMGLNLNDPLAAKTSVEQQLKLSYKVLLEPQSTTTLLNYLNDYRMMFSRISMDKDLMMRVVALFCHGIDANSIPVIQIAYWACDKRLNTYDSILSVLPELSESICELLSAASNLSELDTEVCAQCLDFLDPVKFIKDQEIETPAQLKSWIQRVSKIRTVMNTMLDKDWMYLPTAYEPVTVDMDLLMQKRSQLSQLWSKALFFIQFLRDLAIPAQLSIEMCANFWSDLNSSQEAFQQGNSVDVILKLLHRINKLYSRNDDEYECVICYSIPEDQVLKTRCCDHVICLKCAQDCLDNFKHNGICCYCQQPTNLQSIEDYTIDSSEEFNSEIREAKQKEDAFKQYAVNVIEAFLVNFCLSSDNNELSVHLVRNIIKYVCEDYTLDKKLQLFITSKSMLSSVTRSILRMYMSDQYTQAIKEELNIQLSRLYRVNSNLEFSLALCISQNLEDLCQSTDMVQGEDQIIDILSQELDTSNLFDTLYAIAYARCKVVQMTTKMLNDQFDESCPSDEQLLTTIDNIMGKSSDSIKFFLRELCQVGGISVAKGILSSSKVEKLTHLKRWFVEHPDIHQFLCVDSAIEQSNPFVILYPDIQDVMNAVSTLLLTGDDSSLNKIVLNPYDLGKLKAYLLISIVEKTCVARYESNHINMKAIEEWMTKNSQFNSMNDELFPLVKLFLHNKIHRSLVIDQNVTLDTVWLLRCVLHCVASVLLLGSTKGGLLYKLLLKCSTVNKGYLPTMPDDIRQAIASALSGNFYACPNGHQYFVDRCGKPMEILKCPHCGVDIGGTNHNLLPTNQLIGRNPEDSSPELYALRDASLERETFQVARNMKPKQLRVLRFILHSIVLVGSALSDGGTQQLINQSFTKPADTTQFFAAHLHNDWNLFSTLLQQNNEQTSVLVHLCIQKLQDFMSNKATCAALGTISERSMFENGFSETVNDMFDSDVSIKDSIHTFVEKRQNTKSEMRSSIVNGIIRTSNDVSSVWVHNESITFERFALKLAELPPNDLPLTRLFVAKEEQLRATRYICDILQMFKYLFNRFHKKITREWARDQSMMDVINHHTDISERQNVSTAWQRFKKAWNMSWKFVKQYGCLQIPSNMKNFEMTDDTKLIFMIPNESDECLFCLAFIDHLIVVHNEFVNQVASIVSIEDDYQSEVVSSIEVTKANLVKYSLMKQIVPYWKDHCDILESKELHAVGSDMQNFEQYLCDHVFNGKPLIQAEIRLFDFAGELRKTDARSRLASRIGQEKLDDTMKRELTQSFETTERCSQCFRLIELAINFLQTTGGTALEQLEDSAGDIPVIDYLSDTLLIDDAAQIFNQASKKLRLKHLDSAWTTLEQHLTADLFTDVHVNYRRALPEALEQKLLNLAPRMTDLSELLPPFQEYILNQLKETHTKPSESLKLCLGLLELNDDESVSSLKCFALFPPEIEVASSLPTFLLLSSYEKNKDKL